MFLAQFYTLEIAFSKASAPPIWPGVMSRNARGYLAQWGSPKITTEVFPENESDGTQLVSFTVEVPGV